MPIRDALPSVLRGEDVVDLSPASRKRLEALVDEAQTDRQLPFLRDECAGRLKQGNAPIGVEYLLAEACARNGESERAHQTLLALGDKLAAGKKWEALAAIAEHALALEETHAAARLLVRAHEGLNRDPARIEALGRAWALIPDDLELGLLLTVRLGEAGQGDQRRMLLAELLPRFAADARYAGIEEAALEFVEHSDVEGLIQLVHTLAVLPLPEAQKECLQLLGIAFPIIVKAGRAGECYATVRGLAGRAADAKGPAAAEAFRKPLVQALKQGPASELPEPGAVIKAAGLDDSAQPLLAALERFESIASLPPGRAVHHDSFGAGHVRSNDAVTVEIDFAQKPGHRMPIGPARRTLTAITEDDLRLLRASRPQELARLRADEPIEIMVRALKALGGSADAQKLKVFLVGSHLVPAAEWTSFWRRARATAVKDARIDSSRAFEQHYRVAETGAAHAEAADAPLPALEPRKPVRSNLSTLRKFLSQHPLAEPALSRRFGKYVERAVLDEDGERSDRARAGLFFARWFPERTPEWTEVLKKLWDQGLSISDLSGEDEQIALLEVSHAVGVEGDAILSALDSRFSAVRVVAERFREQQDEAGRAEVRRALLRHAPRYPTAALRVIEAELSPGRPPDAAWRLLGAALALIEERPKASTSEKVLRWIEEGGAFDGLVRGHPCPEDARLELRVLLRQWRSSDRLLFPALEALERFGLGDEAEALRSARKQSAARLFERVGDPGSESGDAPVMTRATWERLHKELEQLDRELRTVLPATIQKARELGDLKENAEYHAAKQKQANVSRQVQALEARLRLARFVDDMEYKEGVVGLGTEVTLEAGDAHMSYWILGEDEHQHGANVISHQATIGKSLVGKTIGDEVELGDGDQRRRYRVASITRKLPHHASHKPR